MSPTSPKPRGHSGPGRGSPRTRAAVRRGERASKASAAGAAAPGKPQGTGERPASPVTAVAAAARVRGTVAAVRGLRFTRRMVAVLVVLGMLSLSYVSSLTVWFRQQQQLASVRAEIAQREQSVLTLEDEIARWQDPSYVKAQARSRLGWVMPGETGYRVIGPDGQPLGGGTQIETEGRLPSDEHPTVWWERMVGSVQTADNPVPEQERPDKVVGPTTPQATSTPSASPTPTR